MESSARAMPSRPPVPVLQCASYRTVTPCDVRSSAHDAPVIDSHGPASAWVLGNHVSGTNRSGEAEMAAEVDAWFKSSFSQPSGECVEILRSADSIRVRDSKDPSGAVLTFTHGEWRAFLAGARNAEFDV
ncbi:DUF397 domain-containing protein [Nonomuraea sp. NPDC050556]|uniref:DUF397 domain-containing protein n=1 Tax=Nonomuraea sp. NPDC050556 TaxID=3364369 RepID=UPI00378C8662